jgi:hypothetical protein
MRALRALSRRLLVAGAALALALFLAELGLRLFLPRPISWLSIYEPDEVLPYRLRPLAQQLVDTGETRWSIAIDSAGYRCASGAAPLDTTAPFLLGLGDSFAFGHGVDQEQSLYARLERELGTLPIRNACAPGYGPVQYRQMLERHLDQPGLAGVIVTSFLGNDFFDCTWSKAVPVTDGALGATRDPRYWLKKTSHLYRFLSASAHAVGLGRAESDLRLNARLLTTAAWDRKPLAPARAAFRAELERMRELCRARGLPLVCVLLPARASLDGELLAASLEAGGLAPGSYQRDLPTAVALELCAELGVPALDATPCLRALPAPLYFRFDGHFRPATTGALAAWLAPRLGPLLGQRSSNV